MCFLCRHPILGFSIINRERRIIEVNPFPPKDQRDGPWLYKQIKAWIDKQTYEPLKVKYNKWLTELGEQTTLLSSLYDKINKVRSEEKRAILKIWSGFLN